MGLTVNGAAGNPVTTPPLIDCSEGWNGPGASVSTQPGLWHRGYAPIPQNSGGTNVGTIFSVTALGTMTYDAVSGLWFSRIASGAARQNRFSGSGGIAKFPLNVRYGAAGSIPTSLLPPLKRYTLTVPMRSLPAVAVVEFGLAVSNGGLTGLGTGQAVVWSSDPARSGGAWEARIRRTSGGAIADLGVSTVIPDASTWDQLGIRYTEGETPAIEYMIDGVPLFDTSGVTNMPDITAISSPFLPYIGINAGVGRTLDFADARFVVEEI